MLPILLLLLAFPDIKRVPIEDELIKEFTMTEIIDETTADCSESSSSGGMSLDPFPTIDLAQTPMPEDTGILPGFSALSIPSDNSIIVTPKIIPANPNPTPGSETPPKAPRAITPEPPPLAILTVSGAALLFLLFGRWKYNRSSRRN